ncbi:MAG: pentapeptide repeat-containing protein [Pseudomonadota bacterium]
MDRETFLSSVARGQKKFDEADLSGADLSDLDLVGFSFDRCKLGKANLRGSRLQGASFVGAELSGADLRGADLRGAILCRAFLAGTLFCEADLSGASLMDACPGESAVGINFNCAKLVCADLRSFAPRKRFSPATDTTGARFGFSPTDTRKIAILVTIVAVPIIGFVVVLVRWGCGGAVLTAGALLTLCIVIGRLTLSRRCGQCGTELPSGTRVGDRCPYCGVTFGIEITRGQ